jgi:phospholipid/cholesterol/gamma-HCH transport system permease protein
MPEAANSAWSQATAKFTAIVEAIGEWAEFSLRAIRGVFSKSGQPGNFINVFHAIGVASVPVIIVTGSFIGMVLSVQAYEQFYQMGLESWLGSMIHQSLIRELGPVLAATMLAGRVGSAMAAELGTMRVTDQIDALACLGVDPVHYLVVPRLLACLLLIPLLTVIAIVSGMTGAALICLTVYRIEPNFYWKHGADMIDIWDIVLNLAKPVIFGGFIALISCHRGFNCKGGSEGVGRAATQAFVWSFIGILALDFILGLIISSLKINILGGGMFKIAS